MSNQVINAMIALIEDRPSIAREMLRNPDAKVSIGEVQVRLFDAINKRETAAKIAVLKEVLRFSLRIDAKRGGVVPEVYLLGVADVEQIIEDIINGLESKS